MQRQAIHAQKCLVDRAAAQLLYGQRAVHGLPGCIYLTHHLPTSSAKTGNHRVVCIEETPFDAKGQIAPVTLTTTGVAAQPLPGR